MKALSRARHFRYCAVRSSRGLSQCLDSGFSGASELLNFVTPMWRHLTGSLSSETIVDYHFSSRGLDISTGALQVDRGISGKDSASSTATWPRPPGSLMVPLTRWVERDGNVLGARCRCRSDYCASLVFVHVGPTRVSYKGSPLQDGEGLGPPASRSTVGCKPGHDSRWTLLTDLQPTIERATCHQRAGRQSGASLDTTRPGTRSQKRL